MAWRADTEASYRSGGSNPDIQIFSKTDAIRHPSDVFARIKERNKQRQRDQLLHLQKI